MQWALFATLYDNIAPMMIQSVDAMIRVLSVWIGPVMRDAALVFIVLKLLGGALKGSMEPISEFQYLAVTGMVAVYLASTVAGYNLYVRDFLLNGLDVQIANALTGATGSRTVTGGAFDELWNRAWVAGLVVYRNLPWSVAGLGLVAVVVLYWVVAMASIMLAFLVWMKAFVFVALLVGLGPLFVGLWFFPLTRGLFTGWLNSTLAAILLKIMSVALLSLVLGAMTRILAMLAATTGGRATGANEIAQLQMLFGGMALFGICGFLALQLPGLAASITHGFAGYGHMRGGLSDGFGRRGGGSSGPAPSAPPASAPQSHAPAAPQAAPSYPAVGPITLRQQPPGRSLSG